MKQKLLMACEYESNDAGQKGTASHSKDESTVIELRSKAVLISG
ncbi:hypothetical protein [Desulfobacter curvatus]|nr:hypothetical protein [Desulfobacter curvatus]